MKTVIIPVGLPGSGKSTEAKRIADECKQKDISFVSVSADNFFYALGDGEYAFDWSKLGEAHDSCQSLFRQALDKGIETVYVDNTNLMREHRKFYVDMAREYGYAVQYIVFPKPKNVAELDMLATRQIHGVPWQGMLRMWENMELPE